jgi:hypothetical protein
MKRAWTLALLLLSAQTPLVRSAPLVIPNDTAHTEISELLQFVAQSGCQFNRNGSWYDAMRAAAHLRYKYERLQAAHQIARAEDFIEKGATSSSMSGKAYQVRCGADAPLTSSQWLFDELARFRAQGAPRSARGAPPR